MDRYKAKKMLPEIINFEYARKSTEIKTKVSFYGNNNNDIITVILYTFCFEIWSHSVAQTASTWSPPAPASCLLGLQACALMPQALPGFSAPVMKH